MKKYAYKNEQQNLFQNENWHRHCVAGNGQEKQIYLQLQPINLSAALLLMS